MLACWWGKLQLQSSARGAILSEPCPDSTRTGPTPLFQVRRLESLPTKQELIATIARLLNQLPIKVARGINQVRTLCQLGRGLSARQTTVCLVPSSTLPAAAQSRGARRHQVQSWSSRC